MADDVQITAGTGTRISTDERTIGGQTVHIQRVNDIGASAIVTARVSVPGTNTPAQGVAARETRKRVVVRTDPTAAGYLYVGGSTLSTSNSDFIAPGESITLHTTAAVWFYASVAVTAFIVEEYDA